MASDGARKQFWKRSTSKVPGSIQHVYGAQHPPFDPLLHGTLPRPAPRLPSTPQRSKRGSSFQEFESNTSDAWDAGEDDDELLAMAAESLDSEVVMETAHRVLRDHSQRQGQQRLRPEPPSGPPASDPRLVKSVSESHTRRPAEGASESTHLQRSQSLPHSATVVLSGGVSDQDHSVLGGTALREREASRMDKFQQLLAGPHTDLEELRKLSWSGIPKPVRPITWKLLSSWTRTQMSLGKAQRPWGLLTTQLCGPGGGGVLFAEKICPQDHEQDGGGGARTEVDTIFERILFIWAIRHPASGYVQGINDLVTPFFVVFIGEHVDGEDVDAVDVSQVPEDVLRNIEADTYWCMSRLLDGIQLHTGPPLSGDAARRRASAGISLSDRAITTLSQAPLEGPPLGKEIESIRGMLVLLRQCLPRRIQRMLVLLPERVHGHLEQHDVKYLQFAFRWMNNLLMRELPLPCTVRLWDTYQELLLFLQNLPTAAWGDEDVSLLLAEAYRLKYAFADAPNHYKK
ncbi:TBC1 domain family member 22A [Echinops telfairi]|uniref:TBC1 domain family member 22A n=1 Tax=Echinops telfairi TaxID=9371 RepID=A0AC55D4E0_ECHTE|nr:TBC1 domain family member 22A [Echinops telfairi]